MQQWTERRRWTVGFEGNTRSWENHACVVAGSSCLTHPWPPHLSRRCPLAKSPAFRNPTHFRCDARSHSAPARWPCARPCCARRACSDAPRNDSFPRTPPPDDDCRRCQEEERRHRESGRAACRRRGPARPERDRRPDGQDRGQVRRGCPGDCRLAGPCRCVYVLVLTQRFSTPCVCRTAKTPRPRRCTTMRRSVCATTCWSLRRMRKAYVSPPHPVAEAH